MDTLMVVPPLGLIVVGPPFGSDMVNNASAGGRRPWTEKALLIAV